MTRDDIIRMAEQAGFVIDKESKQFQPNCISATHHVIDEQLTRFAALVAAAERQRNLEMVQILVEAEREACAKVCEQAGIDGYGTLAAAAMIRARGEK
jgi:2-hydroxychromene-2-carboxylate isomerase